jgi:hypothetical protein
VSAPRAAWLALLLAAGCRRPTPPPVPEPLPPDVPTPRTDGVVAGPRYVVDAPPTPPVPTDVPGQGALSPYVSRIRRSLADRMQACTASPGHGALLSLALGPDGAVVSARLTRPSGDGAWDACLSSSLAAGGFEPPPLELLRDGAFTTDLLFR